MIHGIVDRLRRVRTWVWCATALPLCLIAFAWVGWEQSVWGRQVRMLERLKAHEARVRTSPGLVPFQMESWVEGPLNRMGGSSWVEMKSWRAFRTVESVSVAGPDSARVCHRIGDLRDLRWFDGSFSDLDDATVQSLAGCRRLRFVNLANTRITDRALVHAKEWPELWSLDLSNTDVNSRGLTHLLGCTNLEVLNLDGTRIGDEALATIARLPRLSNITLSNTRISNAGLRHLLAMPQLRSLWLSGSQVTSAGVVRIWRERPEIDVEFENGLSSEFAQRP